MSDAGSKLERKVLPLNYCSRRRGCSQASKQEHWKSLWPQRSWYVLSGLASLALVPSSQAASSEGKIGSPESYATVSVWRRLRAGRQRLAARSSASLILKPQPQRALLAWGLHRCDGAPSGRAMPCCSDAQGPVWG